jgi:hypothetical protein
MLQQLISYTAAHLPSLPQDRRRKKYYTAWTSRRVTQHKKSSRMRLIRNMAWMYGSTRTVGALPTKERRVHAHATTVNSLPKHTYFDTDSYELYVDNRASRCITNDLKDFIDTPVPADVKIYGTNGTSSGTLMGTVEWPIEDDTGRVHNIRIPRTIYSESNRSKLLSPQHWSQEASDRHPIRNGTWCATLDDRIVLFWDQQQYKKTVYLLPDRSNVGVILGAHGTKAYVKAHNSIVKNAGDSIVAMPTVLDTIVHHIDEYGTYEANEDTALPIPIASDDEKDGQEGKNQEKLQSDPQGIPQESQQDQTNYEDLQNFNLDLQIQEEEVNATSFTTREQEYYYWHTKLGHLSKGRMQQLAKRGAIPRHLAKIDPPLCVACIHGKATKKPWRTKTSPSKMPKIASSPGQCISVDQMESSTAGFIGQLKGAILTMLRYKYATVFVDLYSDYTYVYLHML